MTAAVSGGISGCAIDAVLWWIGQTFTYSLHYLISIEVALIDHAVDGNLWKTIESKFDLFLIPLFQGLFWI